MKIVSPGVKLSVSALPLLTMEINHEKQSLSDMPAVFSVAGAVSVGRGVARTGDEK
jgi:hypothetical protein